MSYKYDKDLMIAAAEGDFESAQTSLSKGADVNYADPQKDGWTPLMKAATKNNFDLVNLLLNSNADIEKTTPCGCTALTKTACEGTPEMMGLLLEYGANAKHLNGKGLSLLAKAQSCDNQPVIEYLLDLEEKTDLLGQIDQE